MTGPRDELKRLADTFDAMLERLESSFSSQQRFAANASHELRTPLAVMRMAVDVTAAEPAALSPQALSMVHAVRRAVEDAEALVAKLLFLAKSERGTAVREPVDLSSIADDAIELNKPLARASHISITACLVSIHVPALSWGVRKSGGPVRQAVGKVIPDGGGLDRETKTSESAGSACCLIR